MSPVINISDHQKAAAPKPSKFDLQDVLIVLGFISIEAGAVAIYWPAAAILAGLLFFLSAGAIQRSKQAK